LRYTLEKMTPDEINANMPDLCASYQQAVIDALVRKTTNALALSQSAERGGIASIGLSGGVANNRTLRAALERLARNQRLPLLMAEPRHTGDNAGMIAFAAWADPQAQTQARTPPDPAALRIEQGLELA